MTGAPWCGHPVLPDIPAPRDVPTLVGVRCELKYWPFIFQRWAVQSPPPAHVKHMRDVAQRLTADTRVLAGELTKSAPRSYRAEVRLYAGGLVSDLREVKRLLKLRAFSAAGSQSQRAIMTADVLALVVAAWKALQ